MSAPKPESISGQVSAALARGERLGGRVVLLAGSAVAVLLVVGAILTGTVRVERVYTTAPPGGGGPASPGGVPPTTRAVEGSSSTSRPEGSTTSGDGGARGAPGASGGAPGSSQAPATPPGSQGPPGATGTTVPGAGPTTTTVPEGCCRRPDGVIVRIGPGDVSVCIRIGAAGGLIRDCTEAELGGRG